MVDKATARPAVGEQAVPDRPVYRVGMERNMDGTWSMDQATGVSGPFTLEALEHPAPDRWDRLLAGLVAEGDSVTAAERTIEAAELAQAEAVGLRFAERLAGSRGMHVRIYLRNGAHLRGTVLLSGETWSAVRTAESDYLVMLSGVVAASWLGPPRRPTPMPAGVPLRTITQSGLPVLVDAGIHFKGRLVSVTADHLELMDETGERVAILLAELLTVRCARGVIG